MVRRSFLGICAALSLALVLPSGAATKATEKRAPGLYGIMQTTAGTIVIRFYEKEAPKTVQNFVGLASGTKEWTDPKTSEKVKKPFYNGIVFHRVIQNFMIQGGDPLGTGAGGPGYQFEDELPTTLDYTPGTVAMANAGPNTNGSQFFIMHGDWSGRLPKNYSIFGKVVSGMDVVNKIASAETVEGMDGANSKPVKPVRIVSVKIERVGAATRAPAKKPVKKTASG